MRTECTPVRIEFKGLGRRRVQGAFDGGHISSDGGAVLLHEVDLRLGITERPAGCFSDYRDRALIEHSVLDLVRQRVYGIALGYEDLNDHDDLKWDPLFVLESNPDRLALSSDSVPRLASLYQVKFSASRTGFRTRPSF